jgi:DNA-binding Lrp family transcriptional regulator
MKKQDIDEIDLKILAILQDNAAITNKDLATEIGLSAPPTLARVNALKDKGAIKKYIIQIDYAYLKLSVHKLVAVKIKKDDLQKALILWKSLPWLSGFTVTKPNVLTGNIWIYGQFCVPSEEVFKTVTDR